MRFVPAILSLTLLGSTASAAPGDTYDANSSLGEMLAVPRQARSVDKPVPPKGFVVRKSISNLGDIVDLAVIENDVFVADRSRNRILRLKSANANGSFETRAEFLIGFDRLNDLATADGILYMSDKAGVWKIEAGTTLVAQHAPELVFQTSSSGFATPISIAISADKKSLIAAHGGQIWSVDLKTGKRTHIAQGPWEIQDIAVSPSGGIWAAVIQNGTSFVLPIRASVQKEATMQLPAKAIATHIRFLDLELLSKDWSSHVLFSIKGAQPMIARARFNYGNIDASFASFIDGFSTPSRFVGKREVWGAPTAFDILVDGSLIFAEGKRGTLWVMSKQDEKKKVESPSLPNEKPLTNIVVSDKKETPPSLPRGSSITSASALETDDLLKAPKIENDETED